MAMELVFFQEQPIWHLLAEDDLSVLDLRGLLMQFGKGQNLKNNTGKFFSFNRHKILLFSYFLNKIRYFLSNHIEREQIAKKCRGIFLDRYDYSIMAQRLIDIVRNRLLDL